MASSAPRQGWFPGFVADEAPSTVGRGGGQWRREDSAYPASFLALPNPPACVWWAGQAPTQERPLLAIVGARAATRLAVELGTRIAHDLAVAGHTIVSGGAFGIDAAAHEGALAAGAPTVAVLGCGTDVVYPDRHGDLFDRIRQHGTLLSEYAPGTQPRRGQFPARNRLIAALASAVIVVEAAARSGALITAAWAERLGKRLFVVPGSAGTDGLIRSGKAVAIASADEVLRGLAGELLPTASAVAVPLSPFAPLLDAITSGADTPALLSRRLGVSLPSILGMLAEVELEGWVRRAGGTYEVIGRGC